MEEDDVGSEMEEDDVGSEMEEELELPFLDNSTPVAMEERNRQINTTTAAIIIILFEDGEGEGEFDICFTINK